MRRVGIFLGFMLPTAVSAAPFCLDIMGVPPQCLYYDAHECQKEAARQHGACTDNAPEYTPAANIGHYCVVTSQRRSACYYFDNVSCHAAALQQGGACIYMERAAPVGAPNPFGYYVPVLTGPAKPAADSLTTNPPRTPQSTEPGGGLKQ